MSVTNASATILWFEDEGCRRTPWAGGKGASLALMAAQGLPVPPGFVVAAPALERALELAGRLEEVRDMLSRVNGEQDVAAVAAALHQLVLSVPPQGEVAEGVVAAYRALGGGDPPVAVRSSACAEDGELASFAGQQETYLNVRGADEVVAKVRQCWASFFSERALFYRRAKGSLADLGMAVVVQRQLQPQKAGVMFTIDPVRRRRDQMVVEAAWGLGEAVVSGRVIPDNYILTRSGTVKSAHVAHQDVEVVWDENGGTKEVPVPPERAAAQVVSEEELLQLMELGLRLEEAFGQPQDIEWAIEDGQIYLLQSRPVTA